MKNVTKKQKQFIDSVVKGMRLCDACFDLGIPELMVFDWMVKPEFSEALVRAIQFRLVAARIEVASNAMTAACQLLELCKNDKLDMGRKACIDVLSGMFLHKDPSITVQTDSQFRKAVLQTAEPYSPKAN